jgi:hypothetical protein
MMDISRKTPAALIDELVTTRLKWWSPAFPADIKPDLEERAYLLRIAIEKAIALRDIGEAIDNLIRVDIECFFAQEKLFEHQEAGDKIKAGEAAIETQRLNAARSNWLRTIDSILGFGNMTQTGKTYDSK